MLLLSEHFNLQFLYERDSCSLKFQNFYNFLVYTFFLFIHIFIFLFAFLVHQEILTNIQVCLSLYYLSNLLNVHYYLLQVSATCDSNEVSSVEQMQQAMNTCEKRVPQSDFFAKHKKQDFKSCSKIILDQSKCLNVLTKKVGDALSECTPPLSPSISHVIEPFNSFRPNVKTVLTSIGFDLQKIPESKQLDFLITTMQLIKQYTETM